jgi:NADH:ubiquinone oxidoreductase subunit E
MKKVNVTICTGTTCYLMGATHLLTFDEVLDPCTRDHVTFSGSHCLGLCNDEANGKAPFAKVDDHIIADATLMKILDQVQDILEKGE